MGADGKRASGPATTHSATSAGRVSGSAVKQVSTRRKPLDEVAALGKFGSVLIDIGWQLAITVVGFLLFGRWLDKRYDTDPLFTAIGFILIIISFVFILIGALRQIPRSLGGLALEDRSSKLEGGNKK